MIRFTIYLISILYSCTMYRHMARSLWGKSLGTACLYHFSSSICCYTLDCSDESNKQVTESSIHEMVVCCQVFSSFFLLFLGCTVSTPSSSRLSNPGLEVILIKIAESWTCFRSQVWKHSWGRHNQNSRDHQSPIFMEKVAYEEREEGSRWSVSLHSKLESFLHPLLSGNLSACFNCCLFCAFMSCIQCESVISAIDWKFHWGFLFRIAVSLRAFKCISCCIYLLLCGNPLVCFDCCICCACELHSEFESVVASTAAWK